MATAHVPFSVNREFMLRAIELSKKCKSETGKISPKVAAVIVRDGKIIGEAFRGSLGQANMRNTLC